MMDAETRWETLLARLGIIDRDKALYQELHRLYTESHRAYHNLQHISDCLIHLDRSDLPDADSILLELAIWYHDAIYAPFRRDNEDASAQLAKTRLLMFGLDDQIVDNVEKLILITRHNHLPANQNEALMVDIDLAILGSDQDAYMSYETAIRQEYRWVPERLYRRKRKAILNTFLMRDGIYFTTFFGEMYEKRARINLKWAIERLQ